MPIRLPKIEASMTFVAPYKESARKSYSNDAMTYHEITFDIEGTQYLIKLSYDAEYDSMHCIFGLAHSDDWEATNKNNSFRVLSTVWHVLLKYINKIKPEKIAFSAARPELKSLYDKTISKIEKLGYKLDKDAYDYDKKGKPEYYFIKE